eukprot:5668814-Pyramimonas_sp.AAC.1
MIHGSGTRNIWKKTKHPRAGNADGRLGLEVGLDGVQVAVQARGVRHVLQLQGPGIACTSSLMM